MAARPEPSDSRQSQCRAERDDGIVRPAQGDARQLHPHAHSAEDAAAMIVRVATSVAENLRGNPLALALVVINVMFLCAGLWFMLQVSNATSEERTARHEMMEQLVKYCLDQKR